MGIAGSNVVGTVHRRGSKNNLMEEKGGGMVRTREGRVVDIIEADMVTGEVMIEIGWNRELRIIKVEDLVADGGMDEIKQEMYKIS